MFVARFGLGVTQRLILLIVIVPVIVFLYMDLIIMVRVEKEMKEPSREVRETLLEGEEEKEDAEEEAKIKIEKVEEVMKVGLNSSEYHGKELETEDKSNEEKWVEDTEQNIMDAKVMKKGNKKMIIVDLPEGGNRWRRPGR